MCGIFFVPLKKKWNLFPRALCLLYGSPVAFWPAVLGAPYSCGIKPLGWGVPHETQTPCSLGVTPAIVTVLSDFVGCLSVVQVLTIQHLYSSYPSHCVFSCGKSFLLVFNHQQMVAVTMGEWFNIILLCHLDHTKIYTRSLCVNILVNAEFFLNGMETCKTIN